MFSDCRYHCHLYSHIIHQNTSYNSERSLVELSHDDKLGIFFDCLNLLLRTRGVLIEGCGPKVYVALYSTIFKCTCLKSDSFIFSTSQSKNITNQRSSLAIFGALVWATCTFLFQGATLINN